jgi:hypothetical protein
LSTRATNGTLGMVRSPLIWKGYVWPTARLSGRPLMVVGVKVMYSYSLLFRMKLRSAWLRALWSVASVRASIRIVPT